MVLPLGLTLGQAAFGAQTGASILQGISGFIGARDAAKNAEKQWAAISRAAQAESKSRFERLNAREVQTVRRTQQIIANVQRSADNARGNYAASTGAAGVSGNTVAAMERDLGRQKLSQVMAQQFELADAREQLDEQRRAAAAQATNRITNAMNQYQDQTPDLFGTLFQIGASALGSYADNTEMKSVTNGADYRGWIE